MSFARGIALRKRYTREDVAGTIPRSIPLRPPRLAVTVSIGIREGGTGSVPFPAEIVVAGDVVLVCSGTDRAAEGSPHVPVRTLLAGFDARTGEQRYLLDVFHGRKDPPAPDQVSLPGVATDGHVAQLLRRGDAITLAVGSPTGRRVIELEPTMPRLLGGVVGALSGRVPAPGGSWILSAIQESA